MIFNRDLALHNRGADGKDVLQVRLQITASIFLSAAADSSAASSPPHRRHFTTYATIYPSSLSSLCSQSARRWKQLNSTQQGACLCS
jgi:hypothetical protein